MAYGLAPGVQLATTTQLTIPQVGGGGDKILGLTEDRLFERMCAWEDANYMMAAATRDGSDTQDHEGVVDGHGMLISMHCHCLLVLFMFTAYTILDVQNDVAGTTFDLIKVRNPWGKGSHFHSSASAS